MDASGNVADLNRKRNVRSGRLHRCLAQGAALFAFLLVAGPVQMTPAADRAPLRTAPNVVQPSAPQRVAPPAVMPNLQRGVLPVSQVMVAAPKAGETIPLSGGVVQIQFSAKNMDPNKQLAYMPELVRNGVVLGAASTMGFVLNLYKDPQVVGAKAGHYLANYADQLAAAGGGYQYRITVYEGTWGKGHKVVAMGQSGIFTFGPAPVAAGPPQVTVAAPKAGETIPLSGGVVQIQFSAKNMDPNKQLAYMPELVRNGVVLGAASTMGFVLNLYKDPQVVGAKAGHYLANYADQLAAAGGGYQYRITVYEGTWGKGHKVVAMGQSGIFTFGP